eukprot:5269414-Prymnesium_polylepis.1
MVGTSANSDVASISFSRQSTAGGFSHGQCVWSQDQQTCTEAGSNHQLRRPHLRAGGVPWRARHYR